ncbi:hypothetical protein CCH79_00013945, partial [Gambusia affinis]
MGKYYRFVFEKKRINGYSQSVALLPPTPGEVACDWSKAQRRQCLIEVHSKWNVNCNPEKICALKGSTVKMHCEYSHPGDRSINVEKTFWFTKTERDPLDLKTQEEYVGRVEDSCFSKYCTLIIRDVKESDSATYKFRFITNKYGYTGEPGVQLSVTGYRGYSCNAVTYSDVRICALKGSSVSFYSNYNSYSNSYPTTSFWFSPGRSTVWIDSSQSEDLRLDSKYVDRVRVTNTRQKSTLTINNLKEDDSAEYRFIFKTNSFSWGSDLHGTTLTVTDLQVEVARISANQNPQRAELKCHSRCTPANYHYRWFRNGQGIDAPVLTSVSADFTDDIFEGTQVVLKCSSDANPPANYTWYKKTKSSALPRYGKGSEFDLSAIQTSDSGEYFCVANNQLGESRSESLNIDVKYAPKRADVSLSHTEIVEGDSVSLTCSSDGNPAPSYSWYKDNQVMLQGQGDMYQFTSVKSEDSGTYYCEVGNIYGHSPRLPSVSMNPPGYVAAGSSVTLTCSSVANPAATYTWYKEHSTSPAADGQTFTIVDIRGEHGGNYYCQARNSRGHHNSTIHLIVISSSASSAIAGSITFLLLIGLFLSAFIILRKKKVVRQIHQTREGAGDNETKRLGNLGRHQGSSSTAGLGNSVAQDDVCYASVIFSKNQEEPLYSNFVPAEPKTSQNEEKEENVEYSAIMIKNTP